jgi:hypothetical protein
VWHRHGKLEQSYGLPSPRLRETPSDQHVWESFVEIMGVRVGNLAQTDAGPAPAVAENSTIRSSIASIVRNRGVAAGHEWFASLTDGQLLDMQQYNLFPNVTVLVFSDMVQLVRSRPGPTPDDAFMDAFSFARFRADDPSPRVKPPEVFVAEGEQLPLGLVLDQDFKKLRASTTRDAPTGPDAPHPLGDRGVPDRQPPPEPGRVPGSLTRTQWVLR